MRKLDKNEYTLCKRLGRIFEKSVKLSHLSSPMFIKRFMNYDGTKTFFDKSYLITSCNEEDIIYELNEVYSPSKKNRILYGEKEMYWIGFIYGALSFLYEISSKYLFKLFPSKEIIKYYPIYHTFDIETAAERMMENINYVKPDYTELGVKIYKRLFLLEKLESMIGEKVHVYIDRPIGSVHPEHKDLVYQVNYGYIKEVIALDKEYQDAYVLGVSEPIKEFDGIVYAVIKRKNDFEDKLIVVKEGSNYSDEEIKKYVSFQEKYFTYKILRKKRETSSTLWDNLTKQ